MSLQLLFSNHSADIIFSLFCCGALLNFLPVLLGYSIRDPTTNLYPAYLRNLSGFEFTASLVASLATTVPIVVDQLFDRFLRIINLDGNIHQEKSSHSIYVPFRETIAFLLIPDVLILCWIIPFGKYDYLMAVINARDTMYTYSLLSCLMKFSNPVWTWKPLFLIGIPFMTTNILTTFSILSSDLDFIANSGIASLIFIIMGHFWLMIYAIYWIRYLYRMDTQEVSIGTYLCSAYVLIIVLFLLGDWGPSYFPSEPGDPWNIQGVSYLTCYAYLMASSTLCLTVISTRCAGIEATMVIIQSSLTFFQILLNNFICAYL
jgi:hypothetical protein